MKTLKVKEKSIVCYSAIAIKVLRLQNETQIKFL